MKTRFAPSPTGLMHIGNVRTALFNYLFAKNKGGTFLLRIEDTDKERSEKRYVDSLLSDLEWLGIDIGEGPYYQSERHALYDSYYSRLEKEGHAYPCFCTEEQLAWAKKVQQAAKQPPRYPGTCRHLTLDEIQKKRGDGIPSTLRFRIPSNTWIEFTDLIKGSQRFFSEDIGDFIIRRADGSASFLFCNAIDDALMEVTHALRGDDHLTNTPRQLLILKALALRTPDYGHFPLILGSDGAPLSKRNGSRNIQELKQEGYQPLAILNYIARLGHYYEETSFKEKTALSDQFSLQHINVSPAQFDAVQLKYWQKEAMLRLSEDAFWHTVQPFVKTEVPKAHQSRFVKTIQPNILMPTEANEWAEIFFTPHLAYTAEIQAYLQQAGKAFFKTFLELIEKELPPYKDLVSELQKRTGKKGKELYLPLRAALTNQIAGPELAPILELIGRERLLSRLQTIYAHLQ